MRRLRDCSYCELKLDCCEVSYKEGNLGGLLQKLYPDAYCKLLQQAVEELP